ncbi:MAG: hypothetical protein LBD37_00585 [Treponema sp.]|jgi:hypothetical protein|nr:hypothetical protein [Treponema sp.]
MSYAKKHHSPAIDIEPFIAFLEKYARRYAPDQPEWNKWAVDTRTRFWSEVSPLVEEKKCALLTDNHKGKVVIADFYTEVISQIYEFPDTNANSPFPDEVSLRIKLSEDMLRAITLDALPLYLADPQKTALPILKIAFFEGLSPMLVLADAIPHKLMQSALYKIRNYLRNQNNYDYVQHRLIPQMSGKESFVKDMLYKLDLRPLDCLFNIENGGEFAYIFWPYLCAAVKSELKQKEELLTQEIAALQAVYILEIFIYYYKDLAAKQREKELAFKTLEQRLDKSPFIFTFNHITRFKDNSGHDLLKQYSMKELEAYLKKRASEAQAQCLPELLIFRNKLGEQIFINKSKIFPLCARLLGEARGLARKALSKRWIKILKQFDSEPAMERDQDFEKLLYQYVNAQIPTLIILLRDKRLYLIQEELEHSQNPLPESSKLYSKQADLLPLTALLDLKRKDLLTDCKIMLPFWYFIPVVSSVIALFMHIGKKRPSDFDEEDTYNEETALGPEKSAAALVQQYEQEFVPPNSSLDSYLQELEGRWKKIINQDARQQMAADVHTLIKNKLRRMLRVNRSLDAGAVKSMADAIILETPALKELDSLESLRLYIILTIAKLLKKE